ncbi:MAG: phosphodiester glycosidase family protein [Solirubrobacteraceae bacterium]
MSTLEPHAASRPAPARVRRRPPQRGRISPRVRLRRIIAAAALIALLPALSSYVGAIAEPSNSTFGIRSVEWLRDHGAAGIVNKIESIYYSLNQPAKGGPGLHALPRSGLGGLRAAGTATVDRPAKIAPVLAPPLPGEGEWNGIRTGENGSDPPLLVTTFRTDPEYPRIVAGVAWINTTRTEVSLLAGRLEPSVELPVRGPMDVPASSRSRLLATFNSGFKLADSHGGWARDGHTYAPMKSGDGTFVRYTDGRYDVTAWHGGPSAGPSVAFARQNLPLIVSEGRLNPNLSDGPEWGATLGNAIRVWRSGIGVDSHGNLLYAAANDQTVSSLAKILQHAGAVRAMELDINSYWISFNTYGAPGALRPSKLLSETERTATRYLTPDDRDFFAVYER